MIQFIISVVVGGLLVGSSFANMEVIGKAEQPADAIVVDTSYQASFIEKEVRLNRMEEIALQESLGVKSTALELGQEYSFIDADGDRFIPASTLKKYSNFDLQSQRLTVHLPNREPVIIQIDKSIPYALGSDFIFEKGTTYIKASRIGLHAELIDGILWIEQAGA